MELHYKCKQCQFDWLKPINDDFKSASLEACPVCGSINVSVTDRHISVKNKKRNKVDTIE